MANKKILSILSGMILFFSFAGKLSAQGISTQGTDFWLAFGINGSHSYTYVNLQIKIVTDNAAAVKLTYTFDTTEVNVNIPAGSVYTYSFTEDERVKIYYILGGTTGYSLHIESDVPVSVYALNQYRASTDATHLLPVEALGTDYYHIAYCTINTYYTFSDHYTVIATEDATEIYDDATLAVTLQKGEVYSSYYPGTDITGKHITSNYPIAYFVTTRSVYIPVDNPATDCLYEQLTPVNKWGNNFLVPVTHRGIERIRIVASQDGTVITQTGGVIKTDNGGYGQNSLNLDRGQFVELEAYLDSCGCYISANKPVGVCTYLTGMDYPPLTVSKGDPAVAWVPPVEQSINGTLIAPFVPDGQTYMDEHYALIVTPTVTKDLTTVATGTSPATALNGGSWCDNAASGMSFYSLPLDSLSDAYYISNPYGLTVMGYGIGTYESYYYLAGAAMRDLDAAFYVNNIHYQDLDGSVICDTIVTFRASIQYAMSTAPGYLKWYVDSVEQVAVRDSLEWSGTLPVGAHNVYIEVLDMNGAAITLSAAFNVGLAYYDKINATICLGEYYADDNFDTIRPTQAGFTQYDTAYVSSTGCDSIFTLNLTVNPAYYDTIIDTICIGDEYHDANFDIVPTQAGFIDTTLNYGTTQGCDSTVKLELTVLPVYDTLIIDTICFGDTYTNPTYAFLDTMPTAPGLIALDTTLYTVIGGCDSTVRLELTVLPVYDTLVIDTICFGDTYTNPTYAFLDTTPIASGLIALDTTLYTVIGGCDSTVRLELTVLPVYDTLIIDTICFGDTYINPVYAFLDTTPTAPGLVKDSAELVTVIGGCDSIIRLLLTVHPVYHDTVNAEICLGDTYTDNGFSLPVQTIVGTWLFTDTLITVNGCDSITTLFLTVNQSYYDTVIAKVCINEYYSDHGFNIAAVQAGVFTYRHEFNTDKNCDSITVLQLTVNPSYDEYVTAIIYEDEFYRIGNYQYNTPGIHISILQTAENCDSIINLHLDVMYYPPEITAFSPFNKDGINDYLYPGFKIQIFNRYGALIYETRTEEEQNAGWDGRNSKGQNVEPGLYFYILYGSSGKPLIKSSVEVLKR